MVHPEFYVHVGLQGNEKPSWIGALGGELERLGFEGVFLADSLSLGVEPLISLTSFASLTSTLKVGTCVYILPLRNPLLAAKQVSSIHRLSGGRFVFGVGVGWRKWEFDALGISYKGRGERMDEAVEIVKTAWRGDPVSFSGRHFNFDALDVGAAIEGLPPPPIWIGGNSRRAIRRAAKYGEAWIPTDLTPEEYEASAPVLREELHRAGRSEDSFEVCSHLALVLDQDGSKAKALAAGAAERLGEKPEEFEKYALVGDPSAVAERLARYVALGVRKHVLSTFLTETESTMLEKLRLFSRDVVPSL